MLQTIAERTRRTFWLLPAAGVIVAVGLAYALSHLDSSAAVDLGLFAFGDAAAARGLLSTIATATLSVAGITFSVTLVALQLASSQLSPRVLTTFREDRLTQATLAAFLATFSYALVLLGRLGKGEDEVPALALAIAMLAALASLGLFVAFVSRTVASLQASTVIRRITEDARRSLGSGHPHGVGAEPEEPARARAEAEVIRASLPAHPVRAREGGFLTAIAPRLVALAAEHDALVVQEARVGDLVISGQTVATAHGPRLGDAELAGLEQAFQYGEERSMAVDPAFGIRSLADVALRALSPGINDVTTAENAMGALADMIRVFQETGPACPVRVDDDGAPRLLALAPTVDDLVELGFEQVRLDVEGAHPVLAARLVEWLEVIGGDAARRQASYLSLKARMRSSNRDASRE